MAGSWEVLEKQINKVKTVLTNLTPPEPDDDFENERRTAIEKLNDTEKYARVRHTGIPED